MKIKIKAFNSNIKGVKASVTLNIENLFWVNGINIREGVKGDFVSYPSYRQGEDWKSYILAKKELSQLILNKYSVGEEIEVDFEAIPPQVEDNIDEFPF